MAYILVDLKIKFPRVPCMTKKLCQSSCESKIFFFSMSFNGFKTFYRFFKINRFIIYFGHHCDAGVDFTMANEMTRQEKYGEVFPEQYH